MECEEFHSLHPNYCGETMVDEVTIWKSGTNSMASAMLGRAINNLLTCRPKKLESAIARPGHAPASTSPVTLEDSLWFLTKYVRDAAEQEESLDEVLIPLIENSLRLKDSKNISPAFVLLNWLFQDEVLFHALAKDLATVIQRKEDHYIALGWCTLVRGLVQFDSILKSQLKNDSGLRERHLALLKILCSSISTLSLIVCNGSVLKVGFELPTRLAAAAADCILVLTGRLTKKPSDSTAVGQSASSINREPQKRINAVAGVRDQGKTSPDTANNVELGLVLWKNLDNLIVLLEKLQSWSRKSRPLHAEGSNGVLKWLNSMKSHLELYQDESGMLLLSSCWKHYSMLLCLEDNQLHHRFNELIDQYLSGTEFYSEDGPKENEESIKETRKFFVNCLALLLGRLDDKRLSSMMADCGTRMSNVLLLQLHAADEDLILGVVCIFKFTIFKMTDSGNDLNHQVEMETMLPLLLKMLEEYDSASRAAVLLLAHYCSIHANKQSFLEVLKYSTSENVSQRRNAVNFISELLRISASSDFKASDIKEDIAYHLLQCLNDDESVIRNQAIEMLPLIDPLLVLPKVTSLVCNSNSTISSAASNAFVAILKHHNEKFEVISLLLDSLSTLCQAHDLSASSTEERDFSTMDISRIFKLIPEWSKTVQNWDLLVGLLLDKIFSDPSNATIVKFLSCISGHLADAANIVLDRLLLQAKGLEDNKTCQTDDKENLQHMLFDHLCPLLIIKLLPLRIFNELTSSMMYGQFICQDKGCDTDNFNISNYQCLAAYMLNRAFSQSEFQYVKKLAAELCGRIHPQVLYPVLLFQLESATELRDTLRIKASLFILCSSLVIRGKDAVSHPSLIRIRQIVQTILLWPSADKDEVAKVQHGCIDCLALMICAELQDSNNTPSDLALEKSSGGKTNLELVLKLLTEGNLRSCSPADVSESCSSQSLLSPLSYRLCMANVLISACQKIPVPSKKFFAEKTIPHLIHFFELAKDEEIRAACTHVLFSCVYHLKLAVLPYASSLLDISLELLKVGSERERMAGAKLLVSLMGSEDPIVGSISGRIDEIRSILADVCKSNASTDLKLICQKMLVSVTL